jgi:hypothetical protein
VSTSLQGILKTRDSLIEGSKRLQCPRSLKQALLSPARMLVSCAQVPLEAWMSVCVYSVCVVLCVGMGFVCIELIPRPRGPSDCI